MKTLTIQDIQKQALTINKKALKATEKRVLNSYQKIENAQNKTEALLKKGLAFSEKQQDKLFNNLENGKKMIWKNLNKTLDFFGVK
jgi:hypothetical protein